MDFFASLVFGVVGWTVGTVQTAWALRGRREPRRPRQLLLAFDGHGKRQHGGYAIDCGLCERQAVDQRIREGRA